MDMRDRPRATTVIVTQFVTHVDDRSAALASRSPASVFPGVACCRSDAARRPTASPADARAPPRRIPGGVQRVGYWFSELVALLRCSESRYRPLH